jgi:predicted nucleic acid-binding protein
MNGQVLLEVTLAFMRRRTVGASEIPDVVVGRSVPSQPNGAFEQLATSLALALRHQIEMHDHVFEQIRFDFEGGAAVMASEDSGDGVTHKMGAQMLLAMEFFLANLAFEASSG